MTHLNCSQITYFDKSFKNLFTIEGQLYDKKGQVKMTLWYTFVIVHPFESVSENTIRHSTELLVAKVAQNINGLYCI